MSNIDNEYEEGKNSQSDQSAKRRNQTNNAASDDSWTTLLHLSDAKKRNPLNNLYNAHLVIVYDAKVCKRFFYNTMARRPELLGLEGTLRAIKDSDFSGIQKYIQTKYKIKSLTLDNVRHAVLLECNNNEYHPIKNYFNCLKWDEKQRVETWLVRYLGAPDTVYSRTVGRMFLISAVARIMQPGCKVDHTLVLEGDQGEGKSTVVRVLFGEEYFSDSLVETAGRDTSAHVSSKWCLEIPEMHVFNRAETSQLKSFLTRTVERYRPAYGYMEVYHPRQCVFLGTTNQEIYLKDETGGRRFWPVKCSRIHLEDIAQDRDQIWAETLELYRNGIPWWPDRKFEKQHIKPEQDVRLEFDEWQNTFHMNLHALLEPSVKTTVNEIWRVALAMGDKVMSLQDQARVVKMLKHLGWVAIRTNRGRHWIPPRAT